MRKSTVLFAMAAGLLATAVAICPSNASGSWGVGGCGPVGSPRMMPNWRTSQVQPTSPIRVSRVEWHDYDATWTYEFQDGVHTGGYNRQTREYWPVKDGKWAAAPTCTLNRDPPNDMAVMPLAAKHTDPQAAAPKKDPSVQAQAKHAIPLTGVVYPGGETKPAIGYTLNGRPVAEAQAMDAIGGPSKPDGGGVPDDKELPYVFPTGSPSFNARILKDLEDPKLSGFKGKYRVQEVRKDEKWPLQDRTGQVAYATDSVYFCPADGNMQKGYRLTEAEYKGADSLVEGLRKVRPYDPNSDPSPRLPSPPSGPQDDVGTVLFVMVLLLAGAGVCGCAGFVAYRLAS